MDRWVLGSSWLRRPVPSVLADQLRLWAPSLLLARPQCCPPLPDLLAPSVRLRLAVLLALGDRPDRLLLSVLWARELCWPRQSDLWGLGAR